MNTKNRGFEVCFVDLFEPTIILNLLHLREGFLTYLESENRSSASLGIQSKLRLCRYFCL